ncbi:DUF397 domain-containing protein [Streptomyces sp. NPDC004609]|uniref:DUF397 domain-containing protein n=1 Tax=Streptomyces sp. NPDC004609 TaxID=3364704 RepID=UPI0036D03ADB
MNKLAKGSGVINTHIPATETAAEDAWFKSSYSSGAGSSCVEIADLTDRVGIRDSKDKQGAALVVPVASWARFVAFAGGTATG